MPLIFNTETNLIMENVLCPICYSTEFGDFRNRKKIRCVGCGSFERSRYLWSVLTELDLKNTKGPILHIAPEVGIARLLKERYGDKYQAVDFEPEIYTDTDIDVAKIDLCSDLFSIKEGSIGTIIHVHVLEHVRCNVTLVLQELNRIIEPGGFHIMGLPFMDGHSKEDLNPSLSVDYRMQNFGHEDHMRVFGSEDWDRIYAPIFNEFNKIDASSICDIDLLRKIRVPVVALKGKMGHSINVWEKT